MCESELNQSNHTELLTRCQLYLEYAKTDLERWEPLIGCYIQHSTFNRCHVINARYNYEGVVYLEVESPVTNGTIELDTRYFEKSHIFLDLELSETLEFELHRYEEELKRRREFNRLKEEFHKKTSKFMSLEHGRRGDVVGLTDQDIRLAWIWRDNPQNEDLQTYITGELPDLTDSKDYGWGKMLSARAAEKTAAEFFRQSNMQVEDISIQQLSFSKDDRWKSCDLRIGKKYFDVKNARISLWNKQNYVEHCVPRFKQIRRTDNVSVIGVLSDYLYPDALLNSTKKREVSTQILGLTNQVRLKRLEEHFSIAGHLSFSFTRNEKGAYKYLPPWAFEMPNFIYEERDQALSLFRECSCQLQLGDKLVETNPNPFYLAAGLDPTKYLVDTNIQDNWNTNFINIVLSWIRQTCYCHSLAAIFASILKHFVQMVLFPDNPKQNIHPKQYRQYLYINSNYKYPLLICDPLETVNNLVTTLSILWDQNRDIIRNYSIFRLQNALILRARSEPNGPEDTLVAYCGGWIPGGPSCQMYPLIVGREKTCQTCRKLICPKCSYCSEDCPEMAERRSASINIPNAIDFPEVSTGIPGEFDSWFDNQIIQESYQDGFHDDDILF